MFLFRKNKRFSSFIETTLDSLAREWFRAATDTLAVDRVTDRNVVNLEDGSHIVIIHLKQPSGEGETFAITFRVELVCKTAFYVSDVRIQFGRKFEGTGKFFVCKNNGAFGGILLDPVRTEWMAHIVKGVRSTEAFGDILQTHLKLEGHVFVPETGPDNVLVEGWQPPKVGDDCCYGRVFATVLRLMRVSKGWLVMNGRQGTIFTVLISPEGKVLKWDVPWKGDK